MLLLQRELESSSYFLMTKSYCTEGSNTTFISGIHSNHFLSFLWFLEELKHAGTPSHLYAVASQYSYNGLRT